MPATKSARTRKSYCDWEQGNSHGTRKDVLSDQRGFEAKGEVFVIDDLQTSGGQGGSDDVAVQPFQTGPIVGVDAGGGME